MNNELEKSILFTLAYFDLFDYPLTLMELWRYLHWPIADGKQSTFTLFEIQKTLANGKLNKLIFQKDGFYFLKGEKNLIKIRHHRYCLALYKWKIAQKAAWFLRFVPFIKMISVCNTLAYNNPREESDIDFFIIVKSKRIWTARFFSILVIWLLGLRPTPNKLKDKICLSFFITDNKLNLEKIALKPHDIYLTYWIDQIIPLVNREGIYIKFCQNNFWNKTYLPYGAKCLPKREIPDSFLSSFVRRFLEKILNTNPIEKMFKKIQLIFMSPAKKNLAKSPGREVIISDKILKFHEKDKRAEIRKRFEEKINLIFQSLNEKSRKIN